MNDCEKQLTLAAATLGSFVTLLDSSVVHVALPAIRDDLGGGLAGQQWVVYGERRMFMIGITGFGVASLACAIAPTVGVLIASRAVQGAFGTLLMPASLAVLVVAFRSWGARPSDRDLDGVQRHSRGRRSARSGVRHEGRAPNA